MKDIAKEVIYKLPNETSMDGIIHALYMRSKFMHGEEQILAGKGIPHNDVKKRLQKWIQ